MGLADSFLLLMALAGLVVLCLLGMLFSLKAMIVITNKRIDAIRVVLKEKGILD